MEAFPYAPRPGQGRLVRAIERIQRSHGHLIVEAGTGMGKTVCALAGAHATQSHDGRRLVYTTRTNSQQRQVFREHRRVAPEALALPIMGRKHLCPLLKDDERFQGGTSEELGRLCRDAKRKAVRQHTTGKTVEGACAHYAGLLRDGTGPVEALLRGHDGTLEALATRVAEAGSCPYEAYKALLPDADAVIVPYVFVIDDRLREALMEWMGTTPDGCHLIVDEAHNLPDAVRQHHSPRLGLTTLERALQEAEQLQDPLLGAEVLATSLLSTFHRVLRDLVEEHARDQEDGWMPPESLDEALMLALRAPGPTIARITRTLHDWGEAVREQKRQEGKLPRSYLGAVGAFLQMWEEVRDAPYVHLAIREPRPSLEAYLLEPSSRMAWLLDFASTVHMSGTLAPLDGHRVLCGLPEAERLQLDSPFEAHKLRVYGVQGQQRALRKVQEDPAVVARQQEAARALLAGWTGRIGLWFPSRAMLADYLEEGFLHGVQASVHVEQPDMTTPDLMALVDRFLRDDAERVVLCGVLGGRLTEGLDYRGDAMEHMILFGVPYPKPTARSQALIHHHEIHHGNGWRFVVHDPVGRVMRQAVGRLVRGPDDEGTAVVLDERIARFRDRFPQLCMVERPEQAVDEAAPLRHGFHPAASWA